MIVACLFQGLRMFKYLVEFRLFEKFYDPKLFEAYGTCLNGQITGLLQRDSDFTSYGGQFF